MNKPDETVYLRHMLDAIARIDGYVSGVDETAFRQDLMRQDAVMRQVQIIGEAVRRLSPQLRARHPDVPWQDIAGMRHKLVHDYFGINLGAVWDTATKDLLPLKTAVERILREMSSAS